LILLDKLVRKFDEFRAVAFKIQAQEIELAPVQATVIIHHSKVGRLSATDGAIFGKGSGIGHEVANLNFGIRRARIVAFLRKRRRGEQGARQ
jgi:hypothetical protein